MLRTVEWKLAQRITATPPFQRSAFLTNFLLYICNRKLSNREDEISESQIGVQAFGRPASYNPGDDNIVRNYARMLRRQLDEYFTNEGRNEPMRIVIPLGRYVPMFEPNIQTEAPQPALPITREAESPVPSQPELLVSPPSADGVSDGSAHRLLIYRSIAAVVLLLVALVAGWSYSHSRTHPANPDLYTVFWKELFFSDRPTYIVTGDSGFALLQDMTRREIGLPEYVNGDFDKWFPGFDATLQRNSSHFDADRLSGYTSVADLNTVVALMRLPEVSTADVLVRNARDIHVGEIRRSNVILLGGPLANPWDNLFAPNSSFLVRFSPQRDERSMVNLHPHPGEQSEYLNGKNADPPVTYVSLSFLPNLDGDGHALLIQGLSISGTQAGADFILNRRTMMSILQHARQLDGSIGRFEVLLKTQSIGASAANSQPVVVRYGRTS